MVTRIRRVLALITIVMCLLLSFSNVASAHSSTYAQQSITHVSAQPAKPSDCGWQNVDGYTTSQFQALIWEYTCDQGYHAQLIAKAYGTFTVYLYGDNSICAYDSSYMTPGSYINTITCHGYSSYYVRGFYTP